jgi:hypothetical protein
MSESNGTFWQPQIKDVIGRRYIVVHEDDLEHLDGLVNHFHNNKVNGLTEILPVEGWNLTYMDPDLPRCCMIYEVAFQAAR